MRYRIDFPCRVVGWFMVPPRAIGKPPEANDVRTTFSLKNKFAAFFSKKFFHGQCCRSVTGSRPILSSECTFTARIDKIYCFLCSGTAVLPHYGLRLVEIDFGQTIDDIMVLLIIFIVQRAALIFIKPCTAVLFSFGHASFALKITFTFTTDGIDIDK